MNKIVITGCARSGTTLLLFLARYFENCQVMIDAEYMPTKIDKPESIYYIPNIDRNKNLIIKRPIQEIGHDEYESISDMINCGFTILYLIRDGRDVMVSKHPPDTETYHVSPKRWIETINDLMNNHDKNIYVIKYEDMVARPKVTMDYISNIIGNKYSQEYNGFYLDIPDSPMITGGHMKSGFGFKGTRPIQEDSIGNWKLPSHTQRMRDIVRSEYICNICDLLIRFGYEKDNEWINRFTGGISGM